MWGEIILNYLMPNISRTNTDSKCETSCTNYMNTQLKREEVPLAWDYDQVNCLVPSRLLATVTSLRRNNDFSIWDSCSLGLELGVEFIRAPPVNVLSWNILLLFVRTTYKEKTFHRYVACSLGLSVWQVFSPHIYLVGDNARTVSAGSLYYCRLFWATA